MALKLIPTRPKEDKYTFPAIEKDLIAYAVAMGVPNDVAFHRFHPEYTDDKGNLTPQGRRHSKDFWQLAKHRNFRDDYSQYLKEWIQGKATAMITDDEGGSVEEISEDKKRATITKMLNQLVKLIGNGNVTGDDLKTYSEIMKKVGWLKDDVEEQEAPRRYLPCRCGECDYRSFVESHIEGGEIINECDFCRTRRFAEENGWHYDPTKNLDLPKELTNQNNQNNETEVEH